jgi:hypothetical protein
VRCYAFGKMGHMSWDCPKRNKGGESHISKAQKRDVEEEGIEEGISLMMKKVLLK